METVFYTAMVKLMQSAAWDFRDWLVKIDEKTKDIIVYISGKNFNNFFFCNIFVFKWTYRNLTSVSCRYESKAKADLSIVPSV